MPPMLRALRPKQWLKNVLVFAAPGAAGVLDDAGDFGVVKSPQHLDLTLMVKEPKDFGSSLGRRVA
mgnify:CR=1 FL=1